MQTCIRIISVVWLSAVIQAPALAAEQWIYKVKPGDNIWNFTKQHLTSMRFVKRVQDMNNVENPKRLPPGSSLKVPLNWLKVRPVPVVVHSTDGTVSGTNVLGTEIAVKAGARVLIGSTLRTGEDGNIVIVFADKSQMAIRADSEVVFDSMSAYGTTGMVDSRMRLQKGRVGATVNKAKGAGSRFEITTPAAVAAVRGTVERITAIGDLMRAEVTEGEILVASSSGRTRVPEGFGTRAKKGKAPEPARELLAPVTFKPTSALVERLPIRLSWNALAGASAYRVQVAQDASFATLIVDTVANVAALRDVDLADGEYFLRVRAIDADQLEGKDAELAVTVNARPEPPFARAPRAGSTVRDNFAALSWTRPDDAVGYTVQLARDQSFANLVTSRSLTDTSYQPTADVEFGDYYWRVATKIASGEVGPFGDSQKFTLKPAPPQPQTEPPGISEKEVAFRWSKGEPGQRYRFQFARDQKFADLLHDVVTNDPSIVIAKPESGAYRMRVAIIDTDEYQGPFSTAQAIDIPYDGYWHLVPPGIAILILLL